MKEDAVQKSERRRRGRNARQRWKTVSNRVVVLYAYGGQCECCGEGRYSLLTMDHQGGWGGWHRQLMKDAVGYSGQVFYRSLIVLGFPVGYRILCWNCNMVTRDGGPCRCAELPLVSALVDEVSGEVGTPPEWVSARVERARRHDRHGAWVAHLRNHLEAFGSYDAQVIHPRS